MGLAETLHEYKFVLLTVAFLVLAYYIYHSPVIYWFHMHGCPHCDNMRGEIDKVRKRLSIINRLTLVDTADPKNKKLTEEFKITGVPHLVKVVDGKKYVYGGNRNAEDIMEWIKE